MKTRLMRVVLGLGIAVLASFSTHPIHAQATPKQIEITAKRFAFTPDAITLKKGQPVVLIVKSLDVAHGLRFRELNLNVKVNKGGTAELKFTPAKTGDFVGQCSVFCGSGHGRMILTLHVTD